MSEVVIKNGKKYRFSGGFYRLACIYENCSQIIRHQKKYCDRHQNGKDSKEKFLLKHVPGILDYWDYDKNIGINMNKITKNSNKKVYWKCPEDIHESYTMRIADKVLKNLGCPYCSGKRACVENSLLTKFPQIAEQWDYEKNEFGPDKVTPWSGKKVWWKCENLEHPSYDTVIGCRVGNNTSCPYCSGKKVCKINSLAYLRPDLLEEWDYEKNDSTPDQCSLHSGKKVWWKCKINPSHLSWKTMIAWRTHTKNPTGCPMCKQSKGEQKITDILNKINNLTFERQFRFDKHKRHKFDFLITYKGKKALIEFDGKQHFEMTYYYKTQKDFLERKRRDNFKTNLCEKYNIPLLRITYSQNEMNVVINNFLVELDNHDTFFLYFSGDEYWNLK